MVHGAGTAMDEDAAPGHEGWLRAGQDSQRTVRPFKIGRADAFAILPQLEGPVTDPKP